jgi:hypothetical protein
MRYRELTDIEPQIGDVLGIEFGDTLVEATIQDVREDGVVIVLDQKAVQLLSEGFGNPAFIAQNPEPIGAVLRPDDISSKSSADIDNEPKNFKPAPQTGLTLSDCKNALDWGIKFIESLNNELKKKLRNSVKNTALEYLVIVASRTDAFDNKEFTEEQLRSCEPYLSYAIKNPSVKTWDDVVKYFSGDLNEAEYRGRKVSLGKPMQGDVKKSKVYVKGPNGNVVKVNFGDPNMKIKKSNPQRRKSFRARHNCDNPGPRWKARYWSCRAW